SASTNSGVVCAQWRNCPASGCTICAIRSPALARARRLVCRSSGGCSAIRRRKRRRDTVISRPTLFVRPPIRLAQQSQPRWIGRHQAQMGPLKGVCEWLTCAKDDENREYHRGLLAALLFAQRFG